MLPRVRMLSGATIALGAAVALGPGLARSAPLGRIITSSAACPHGTHATWKVAYETFASVAFRSLNGRTVRQNAPAGGAPTAALTSALQQTADTFGQQSRCAIGLHVDLYWAPKAILRVRQEPYKRLLASDLPVPARAPGGPRSLRAFYSRYDSVMEQFSALGAGGETLLGPGFEGETFGYVSLIDSAAPDPSVLEYELLQGMTRFFTHHGARIAPNPRTYMDAYCSALRRLGYSDRVRVSPETCTSDRYALDVIAGRVPRYRGVTTHLWRNYSPTRSYRRHGTIPAGLPAGHGQITSGADA